MAVVVGPPFLRRALAVAALAALSACQTPSGGGFETANPHYKIGAPYQVQGKWYHPKEDPNYEAVGVASWYGDDFQGKRTANGEVFDKTRLSAAHTTLPLPSMVEVQNLENGRKVTVRVNDRGPFVENRLIDLSHAAAAALGFEKQGLARVHLRYLNRGDLHALALPGKAGGRQPRKAAEPTSARPDVVGPKTVLSQKPTHKGGSEPPDPLAGLIATSVRPPPTDSRTAALPQEIWIVVAEYDDLNALETAKVDVGADVRIVPLSAGRFQLRVGPHADELAAEARLAALREAGYSSARFAEGAL